MRVLKYSDYNKAENLVNYFVSSMNVSDSYDYKDNETLKNIFTKLNINPGIEDSLKNLINPSYNIVEKIMNNSSLNVELTADNLNLLNISVLMVYYLEAFKSGFIKDVKPYENSELLISDIKNLLEELKLSGIGNGIVKKIVECFKSISEIVKELLSNSENDIECIFCIDDSKLTTILNAISLMIDKYKFNIENFNNLHSELSSMGISYLVNKLNKKLNLGMEEQPIEEPKEQIEIIKEEDNK